MERKYQYKEHIRKPFELMIKFNLIMFITAIYFETLAIFNLDNHIFLECISLIIYLLELILVLGIETLILCTMRKKKYQNINVTLNDNAIIYNNNYEEIIPYENIEKIKFKSINYSGGWLKIIHRNGTIKLTMALENIENFTENLREQVDKKNKSYTYDEQKINKFYKTAILGNYFGERIKEKKKLMLILTTVNMIVSYFIALSIPNIDFRMTIGLMAELSVCVSFAIWMRLIKRPLIKKNKNSNTIIINRDIKKEEFIYKSVFLIVMSIQVIITLILVLL